MRSKYFIEYTGNAISKAKDADPVGEEPDPVKRNKI